MEAFTHGDDTHAVQVPVLSTCGGTLAVIIEGGGTGVAWGDAKSPPSPVVADSTTEEPPSGAAAADTAVTEAVPLSPPPPPRWRSVPDVEAIVINSRRRPARSRTSTSQVDHVITWIEKVMLTFCLGDHTRF